MAIASCSVKLISRGQGRSAVAAAAYRSGTKMRNEYDGLFHDYTRKSDIAYTAILAPQNSQDWVYDRVRLWNQAELTERRGNSRLAREVMIALPRELSQEQNIQLAREYAQTFVKQGMVADLAFHDSRDGNPHAHIMLTTRLLDGDKFGKKCRDWDSRELLISWREQYAELTNQYLERYGHKERIDARSYAAQGVDRIPTIHLGPYAHRMKQQGVYTERWEINQRIEEQNKELAEINKQIEAYQKEAECLERRPELDTLFQEIHLKSEKKKRQDDFRYRYGIPTERQPDTPSQHTRAEEFEQERQRHPDNIGIVPENTEQEPPSYHPRIEEQERKRASLSEQQAQKCKEHRLVRDQERQSRRYQNAYKQAEERDRKVNQIEQTQYHNRPESPKPERKPDYRGKYKITERRHHDRERRYGRSRDEPEHEN